MSLDPETERQISELSHDPRPLIVLDVDDVVLEFIRPFPRFLDQRGFALKLGDFRLAGNITHRDSGEVLDRIAVRELVEEFFNFQADWQTVTEGAAEVLGDLGAQAEIVMLTAMPHRFRDIRRDHLNALGLSYPLLTVEMEKGPAIARLRGDSERPVAFVDDQPRNLVSAHQYVPDAHLFHLMADNSLRKLLPAPEPYFNVVEDWREAKPLIVERLGL